MFKQHVVTIASWNGNYVADFGMLAQVAPVVS